LNLLNFPMHFIALYFSVFMDYNAFFTNNAKMSNNSLKNNELSCIFSIILEKMH
jgi:hypothetical protein